MSPMPPDATAVFIDGAYLDKLLAGPLAAPGGKPLFLDMKRLPAMLAGGAKPWRTFYYHAYPWVSDPPLPAEFALYERKRKAVEFLAREPRWVVRTGCVERRGGPKPGDWSYEQKRSDVQLAVDLVRLAWRGEISQAVLLAGDSDFVPAVEDARAAGVRVAVRAWVGRVHEDLLAACDDRALLAADALQALARS